MDSAHRWETGLTLLERSAPAWLWLRMALLDPGCLGVNPASLLTGEEKRPWAADRTSPCLSFPPCSS